MIENYLPMSEQFLRQRTFEDVVIDETFGGLVLRAYLTQYEPNEAYKLSAQARTREDFSEMAQAYRRYTRVMLTGADPISRQCFDVGTRKAPDIALQNFLEWNEIRLQREALLVQLGPEEGAQ